MQTITVNPSITKVELYRAGCTIVQQARVDLPVGASHLIVEGLPEGLDDGSVILRMPSQVALGQVRVNRGVDDLDLRSKEQEELTNKLDELDRKIDNKEVELRIWRETSSRVSGSSVIDYLDRLPSMLESLTHDLADLRSERRALAKRRDELNEHNHHPRLEVDLTSEIAGSLPLELSCRSRNAGWSPSYEVRVATLDAPAELRLKGSVWQRTGFDWNEVSMSLSTGTSAVLGDLPRFAPRYLSRSVPTADAPSSRALPMGKASGARMSLSAPVPAAPLAFEEERDTIIGFDDVVEMRAPEAEATEQTAATTYELEGSWTLACDGKNQLVAVSSQTLEATYRLYAYPRKDEAAYLVAHLDKVPSPELFEHPLSIYLEGAYAGTVKAGGITSDEDGYELPLGRDNRIRVQRTESVRRKTTLLGGKVIVEHSSHIVVESQKQRPADIVVLEQVPVSRDNDIQVSVKEQSGALFNEERGELRWGRVLDGEKKLVLDCAYTVSYPKGLNLTESERGTWTWPTETWF